MKAVKQRRAPTERPGEIIDAALALFVEKGFAATRLDDVAERAGLSKAAIYLYFEDKTALFQGVVRQAVAVNLGTVEAMVQAHRGPVAPLLPHRGDRPRHSHHGRLDLARHRPGRVPRGRPRPDGALDHGRHAARRRL